jgi:parallel beta-helix repeat protein
MKLLKITGKLFLLSFISVLALISCEKSLIEPVDEKEVTNDDQSLLKTTSFGPHLCSYDILVNTTSDVADFNGNIEDLPGPDGVVSLREAIIAAHNPLGRQSIGFNIPINDEGFNGIVFTIKSNSDFSDIYDNCTFIDGSTQTYFTGNTNETGPEIKLDLSLHSDGYGFLITSSFNTIHSLLICKAFAGIEFRGVKATYNRVSGCFITENGNGINIINGASLNTIGGISLDYRNTISGNTGTSISIWGDPDYCEYKPFGNRIIGNFIGTDYTGSKVLPNGSGIAIIWSLNNIVGGNMKGEGNLISGNNGNGIDLINCSGNKVIGNLVGTDVTGRVEMGNLAHGIAIADNSFNNTIERNVVSANKEMGICFWNNANNNSILGNLVGTDIVGTRALGNRRGITLWVSCHDNTIGGLSRYERNIISANKEAGIQMGDKIYNNQIIGNYIGTNIFGQPSLGNGTSGISIFGVSTDNTIGGTVKYSGNTIAGNNGPGIRIYAIKDNPPNAGTTPSTGIKILHNMIFSNSALGIDIDNDGVTPNDPGDLDTENNNLMNYPVLTYAKIIPGKLQIKGMIDTQNPKSVMVEFFANPVPAPGGDPSGYGEGAIYLGSCRPNPQGKINITLPFVVSGTRITSTATDAAGNTSEFSASIEAM